MTIPKTFNASKLDVLPDEFRGALQQQRSLSQDEIDEIFAPYPRLNEQCRTVIVLRFGLRDGIPRTLREVGSHLGIQRERVRQIEAFSLAVVRYTAN